MRRDPVRRLAAALLTAAAALGGAGLGPRGERVDYQCADGRRMLVLFQPAQAVVRIERYAPVVLLPVAGRPGVWRSDAYDGGPFILTRTGAAAAALVSPGWPDTTCRV